MAGESVARILISAQDAASATIKSVQGTLNKLSTDAKSSILTGIGLGAGISAFNVMSSAVRGTADALGDMVQNAIADEASVSRLTASLRVNAPEWDGNTDAIEKNILSKQRLGFEDEELRDSLSVLVGATHDVAAAQAIQNTAMDLARFKNIDLHTATEALIKVEGGHYRLLASLGINLRAGADATEALAAVQKVAGGQAEAFGNTTAGAMEGARIAIEEAGEALGKELIPFVKDAAKFIRDDLAPALTDAVGWLGDFGDQIGEALYNLRMLSAIVGGWSMARFNDTTQTDQFLANLEALPPAASRILTAGASIVQSGAHAFVADIYGEAAAARRKAIAEIQALPGDLSKALLQGEDDVRTGMEDLTGLMEDELSDAAQMAYLKGVLASQELANGLNDERASVRAAAAQIKADALEQLRLLESGAADAAVNAGTTFAEQLRLQRVAAGNAARDLARAATGMIAAEDWSGVGQRAGNSFAAGLTKATGSVAKAAQDLKNVAKHYLEFAGSPAYTHSRQIGEEVGESWAKGLASSLVKLPDLGGALPGGSLGGSPMGGSSGGGGFSLPNIIVQLDGRELSALGCPLGLLHLAEDGATSERLGHG